VLNNEEAIEKWKTEARQEKIYKTRDEENPVTLKGTTAARQHFALNHLNQVIRKTHTVTVTGLDSRSIPDADLQKAMRSAYEMEIRFPNRLAQALRSEFVKSGLHVFKHRKRMLYAWSFRPRKLRRGDQALAPMVEEILKIVENNPGLNRHELAAKIIPELDQDPKASEPQARPEPTKQEAPAEKPQGQEANATDAAQEPSETQDPAKTDDPQPAPAAETHAPTDETGKNVEEKKNELAGYLHWLIGEGFVIEFQDGKLEFPIEPKPGDRKGRGGKKGQQKDQPKGKKQNPQHAEQPAQEKPRDENAKTPEQKPEEPQKQPETDSKPEAGAAPQGTAAPELKPQDTAPAAAVEKPAEPSPEPEPETRADTAPATAPESTSAEEPKPRDKPEEEKTAGSA
jgi:hypothetical protein